MRRDALVTLIVIAILVAAALTWLAQRSLTDPAAVPAIDTTALLDAAPDAFRRVTGPEPIVFPADHAAHPGYRSEWWYFTGQLATEEGRRFGFQFTLFRFGLDPVAEPERGDTDRIDSLFAADAVWMAHLALSDIGTGRFLHRERFARGALGLAGATADRWWLRDWSVNRTEQGWRLEADAGEFSLALDLDPLKPVVLQGDGGYSRKGPAPGNASRYYSFTRIDAAGRIELDGEPLPVNGRAWLDREWGSSQLGPGIEGWDWFALQLDDGRDLMLYRLRTDGGEASRFSAGALVSADGSARILDVGEFVLVPERTWRDPDGAIWPVAWSVEVPSAGLDLEVRPVFDDQQWRSSVRYWEGAVEVLEGQEAIGRGYLELSGYAGSESGTPRRRPVP